METATPNLVFSSKYGHFNHNDIIGKPYGSKIKSSYGDTEGYVYVLFPTPELWNRTLQHRTEILYITDISIVLLYLELRPGLKVLESGTGSGSLSSAIARTLAPTGHLYTYEFHEQRAQAAVLDFQKIKLSEFITVTVRDVCNNGFDKDENTIDAVFLDLPAPWKAIPTATKALKPNKRLCSFSPSIEQVQQTTLELEKHNFKEINVIECVRRNYDVTKQNLLDPHHQYLESKKKQKKGNKRKNSQTMTEGVVVTKPCHVMRGHTGFLTFARKSINNKKVSIDISEIEKIVNQENNNNNDIKKEETTKMKIKEDHDNNSDNKDETIKVKIKEEHKEHDNDNDIKKDDIKKEETNQTENKRRKSVVSKNPIIDLIII